MAMTKSHQRSILKIQNLGEVVIYYQNCTFLSKYVNSIS